jgi:hypothetical protein
MERQRGSRRGGRPQITCALAALLLLAPLSAAARGGDDSRMRTPILSPQVNQRTRVLYNLIYNQFASGKSRFHGLVRREKLLQKTLEKGERLPVFGLPDYSKRTVLTHKQARRRIRSVQPRLREEISAGEARALFDKLQKMKLGFGFPDAFCYDRAHLMALELERMGIRSHKVLIHGSGEERVKSASVPVLTGNGDIWAPTSNHPFGWVIWQTHIAPAVKVRGQRELLVMDPSVAKTPLFASRWQRLMNAPATSRLFTFAGHQYNKEDDATRWSYRTVARTLRNVAENRVMERTRAEVLEKLRRIKEAPPALPARRE